MKTPRSIRNTCALVLAALLTAAIPGVASATTTTSSASIPTMLVATDDPTRYPDPICSKCTIIVVEDEDSAGTEASVHITYPVDAPSFVGEINVKVLLSTGETRTLWLSAVKLAPGSEVELVAESDDWSWDQVRFVWLRFVAE